MHINYDLHKTDGEKTLDGVSAVATECYSQFALKKKKIESH